MKVFCLGFCLPSWTSIAPALRASSFTSVEELVQIRDEIGSLGVVAREEPREFKNEDADVLSHDPAP